jgi:hypothetical protein
MALEREDAPFYVSHWGAEDTSGTPHRILESDLEQGELLRYPSCPYQACWTSYFPCYSRFINTFIKQYVNYAQRLTSFVESSSKDSVMNDETTSASAVDVQMVLEHDGLYLRESSLQPSMVIPPEPTQKDAPNTGGLPGRLKSQLTYD